MASCQGSCHSCKKQFFAAPSTLAPKQLNDGNIFWAVCPHCKYCPGCGTHSNQLCSRGYPTGTLEPPAAIRGPSSDDTLNSLLDLMQHMFDADDKDLTFKLKDGSLQAHKAVLSVSTRHRRRRRLQHRRRRRRPPAHGGMPQLFRTTRKREMNQVHRTSQGQARSWSWSFYLQRSTSMPEATEPALRYEDMLEKSGFVELPDVDVVTMRVFLRMLYTGHVLEEDWASEGGTFAEDTAAPPLALLLAVLLLARRYMCQGVLALTMQAVKGRLGAIQESDVQGVHLLEEIMMGVIAADVGSLRMAALHKAKTMKGLRPMYDAKELRPEVQAELQAIWPAPPQCTKYKRVV